MKGKYATVLVFAALALLLAGCGWQKFPEDRYHDVIPPDPPTGLVAVGGNAQVTVSWVDSPSMDKKGYFVYIGETTGNLTDAIDVGSSTSTVITTLPSGDPVENGTLYYVRIRTYDAFANLSLPEDACQTVTSTFPEPGGSLIGVAEVVSGTLQISLTWTASPSSTVAGNYLYVSCDFNGDGNFDPATERSNAINVGDIEAYALTAFQIGTTGYDIEYGYNYFMELIAYDSLGRLSTPITATTTTPPLYPTNLSGVAGNATVTLTWEAAYLTPPTPTPYVVPVQGYIVYVSDDNGSTFDAGSAVIAGTMASVSTYRGGTATLINGQTYLFRVRTVDISGNLSIPPNAAQLSLQPTDTPPPPPGPVTYLDLTPGNQSISALWGAPASGNVTQYQVSWRQDITETNYPNVVLTGNAGTTFLIQGLTNGILYRVRVRAVGLTVNDLGPEVTAVATPGAPNIRIGFSQQGGCFRIGPGAANSNIPSITLFGSINGTKPMAAPFGSIYYTVDGTNPGPQGSDRTYSGAAPADPANGVFTDPAHLAANPGDPEPTLYQANAAAGAAIPLDISIFATQHVTLAVNSPFAVGSDLYVSASPTGNGARGKLVRINAGDATQIYVFPTLGNFRANDTITDGLGNFAVVNSPGAHTARGYVKIIAMFDPNGIPADGDEGIAVANTYFFSYADADTYVPFGGMLRKRQNFTATRMGSTDYVFCIGGIRPYSSFIHNTMEFFNPNVQFFYPGPDLTVNRCDHETVELDSGNMLIVGGRQDTTGDPTQDIITAGALQVFNPLNSSLTNVAGFTGRVLHRAIKMTEAPPNQSRVLVVGGITTTGAAVAIAIVPYMSSTAQVAVCAGSTNVDVGDWLYFYGGSNSGESRFVIRRRYDVTNDTWQLTLDTYLPFSLSTSGDVFDVFRPQYNQNSFYNPATGAVTPAPMFPTNNPNGRVLCSATLLQDGSVLVSGGFFPPEPYPTALERSLVLFYFDPIYTGQEATGGSNNTINAAAGVNFITLGVAVSDRVVVNSGAAVGDVRYVATVAAAQLTLDSNLSANLSAGDRFTISHAASRYAGKYTQPSLADCSALLFERKMLHTSTLLSDGKVLICGGAEIGLGLLGEALYAYEPLSSADVYDPQTENTIRVGSLNVKRLYHTATLLHNGKVLITGGIDWIDVYRGIFDSTATAELYDPVTKTFSSTGSMLEKRYGHQATLLSDGRVLITGGLDDYLPEIYDPVKGIFTATAGSLTGNRTYGAAAIMLQDGKMLVTGGQSFHKIDRATSVNIPGSILKTGETMNPSTSNFTLINQDMTTSRKNHTMTLLDDGRVLIAGGEGGDGSSPVGLSSSEIYNPAGGGTFTGGASMTMNRYGHSATKLQPVLLYRAGTANFNATTTVTEGTGANWAGPDGTVGTADDPIRAGDRIGLDSDSNQAFFEIVSVNAGAPVTLTIRASGVPVLKGAGFDFPIPTTVAVGAQPYSVWCPRSITGSATGTTASFTNGSTAVTGVGTNWNNGLVRPGDLIIPAGESKYYEIAAVNSATQLTLTTAYTSQTYAGVDYTLQGKSKVLLLGGGNTSLTLTSGEVFDPVTNLFTQSKNSMTLNRYAHTATVMPNGWVLIVGGNNNFDRTVELFDPASMRFKALYTTGTFTTQPRNNHSAILMDSGHVFVCGGEHAGTWAEYTVCDSDGNATADEDGDGIASMDFRPSVAQPALTSFQQLLGTNMALGRVYHSAVKLPDAGGLERVILIGGGVNFGEDSAEIFNWDPVTPANSVFLGAINLAREGMIHCPSVRLLDNDNVLTMKSHSVQVFFSK